VRSIYIALVAAALLSGYSSAQIKPEAQSATRSPEEKRTPEQIIQKLSEKESEFYKAWMLYSFTQKVSVRILSPGSSTPKETMTIIYEVVFDEEGKREVVPLRRSGQLRTVVFTEGDQDMILKADPFALRAEELSSYAVKYQGKAKADELECYVFSVKPKKMKRGQFYFEGRIWVDDQDLQVVKTVGKTVPEPRNNQFPEFETIRQPVDNKYWFPVWMNADNKLDFSGQVIRIQETITYEDYKKSEPKNANPENPESKPPDSPAGEE
jgi:hypothetical protein